MKNYFNQLVPNYILVERLFIVNKKFLSFDYKNYYYDLGLRGEVVVPFNFLFFTNNKFFNQSKFIQVKISKKGNIINSKQNISKFHLNKSWCIIYRHWIYRKKIIGRLIRRIRGGVSLGLGGFIAFMYRKKIQRKIKQRQNFNKLKIKIKTNNFQVNFFKTCNKVRILYLKKQFYINQKTPKL